MFITIEKDGSIHIQSHIFTAHYDVQGKLKWACGDMKAPEFIKIKDEREKKSVGFGAESFGVFGGQVFINAPCIVSGTITSAKVQGPAIDDVLRQAAEKGAIEGQSKRCLR
ncbi:hypothetical protein [Providencia stuartii]|uniref:hypothetical protein n=1 Tax=Providencia stuartii TaxID=588 RepID=UPI003001C428